MAGSYCKYCDRRCFVYREVIVAGECIWRGHMATCTGGRAHDARFLGVDYTQAHNPYDPAAHVETVPRVWIDHGGRVVCDHHAGNYLRTAIAHAPSSTHHLTPLGDWWSDTSGQFCCEACAEH